MKTRKVLNFDLFQIHDSNLVELFYKNIFNL